MGAVRSEFDGRLGPRRVHHLGRLNPIDFATDLLAMRAKYHDRPLLGMVGTVEWNAQEEVDIANAMSEADHRTWEAAGPLFGERQLITLGARGQRCAGRLVMWFNNHNR
jgi:hypothetical protein